MTPFTTISGIAAPLMEENIDTDIIFPARFLLITAREGLGRFAFHDRRASDPAFVLNHAPWSAAKLLIADANFGSGSSREQAVWALADFGIRAIIAPSFGEIFRANCFRNAVLPIVLPGPIVAGLPRHAEDGAIFTVDLETERLTVADRPAIAFAIPPEQRLALLNGWNETETILNTQASAIYAFEARQRIEQPWLWEVA